MKKGSKSSWDKKQVRRLERYLKANGYICMGTRRGGSDHIKYTSSITGRSTICYEHMSKMVWKRLIEEVADDLKSKGYNYVPYERVR